MHEPFLTCVGVTNMPGENVYVTVSLLPVSIDPCVTVMYLLTLSYGK